MKKKIILTVLVVLAVLFVPITTYYKEGGTTTHTSLTYKIVKWHVILDVDESEHSTYYTNTRIYLFPNNFKSYEYLWELENVD